MGTSCAAPKVRLDTFLAQTYPQFSRMRWQAHIRAGRIHVNGVPLADPGWRLDPSTPIAFYDAEHNRYIPLTAIAGPECEQDLEGSINDVLDREDIHRSLTQAMGLPAQGQNSRDMILTPVAMSLPIIYEDDHILVLDKPWGLVVHPGAGTTEPTLAQGLLAHSQTWSSLAGTHKPGIVHRLDKDTSGLMVVAKTDSAHHHLSTQFAERTLHKVYWAFVWGTPSPPFGRIEQPLGRDPRNRLRQSVDLLHGRPALTRYRTLASANGISLLECQLHTGRTHQIRVHCAWMGHPLLGDSTYGHGHGHRRQALHACTLGFIHPALGHALEFHSPLAPDLAHLYDRAHNKDT